ncbi:hypothetical protein [Actinomadura sp. 9N407]
MAERRAAEDLRGTYRYTEIVKGRRRGWAARPAVASTYDQGTLG